MMTIDHLTSWARIAVRPAPNSCALFLDRDGTIIENIAYLSDPDRVAIIPGAIETIKAFRAANFAVIIVTNQSGVARGLISPEQYHAVDARMLERLGSGLIDASYACPFHPEGQGDYAGHHDWRKPKGGMMRAAAKALHLDLAGSIMIGDSINDILAAADAGVGMAVHVLTGHGVSERGLVEELAASRTSQRKLPNIVCVDSIAGITPGDFGL